MTTNQFVKLILVLVLLSGFHYPASAAGDESRDSAVFVSLPHLQILGFTGKKLGAKQVELSCYTRIEGNYSIMLERSHNGKQFSQVGDFTGTHNRRLTLVDNKASGNTHYYRLRITDLSSGKITYSKLMLVELYSNTNLSLLSVTPDPLLNDINVDVQVKERALVVMKVTDAEGKTLLHKTQPADGGINHFGLDGTNALQPGSYTLSIVVNSSQSLTVPLLKK